MLNIEQIIKDLYDSEINFHMGFLWDGGIDYAVTTVLYPLHQPIPKEEIQQTGTSDLQVVFQHVLNDVFEKYPESNFTKKYKT